MRLGKFLASVVLSYGLVSCVPAYTAEPAQELNPFNDPQVVKAVSNAIERQCLTDGYLAPASADARIFFKEYEGYTEENTKRVWNKLTPEQRVSADLLLSFQQRKLKQLCREGYEGTLSQLPQLGKALILDPNIYK